MKRQAGGTLLVADRVVTLDHAQLAARAVLVRDEHLTWVGDDPGSAPTHDQRLELHGCTLGPAFVDAHVHLTPTGIGLTGLDLSHVRSGAQLLDAVGTFAHRHTGRVLWGHGYDDHGFPDPLPTAEELADVTPHCALYLTRADAHSCLVNRHLLMAVPLTDADGVELDPAGRPSGVLRRDAHRLARRWAIDAMSPGELHRARVAAAGHAASLGIGSAHEMGGHAIMGAADFDAWLEGRWPIEVVGYWADLDLAFVFERGLARAGGDLFLDGSFGSHTAALSLPYADAEAERGHLYHDDRELTAFFRAATLAGIQVGVHAIGDAAVAQAVRCWQAVAAGRGDGTRVRSLRHRIEHLELIPPELFTSIGELNLVASVQPGFDATWGGPHGMYAARLGRERAARTNPLRTLADVGVVLAFGSDSDVTPMDPWGSVHAAEHRHHPEHAVSRWQAVRANCLGGRYAAFQDRQTGMVRAGLRADLAAWEGDPFTAADPRGAVCVLTVVGGRRAHGEAPLPSWQD